MDEVEKIGLLEGVGMNHSHLRIRQLTSSELYPDCHFYPATDISIEHQVYMVLRDAPYLLTFIDSEADATFHSEGVILNRHELVFATLMLMSGCIIFFGKHYDVKVSDLGFQYKEISDIINNKVAIESLLRSSPLAVDRHVMRTNTKDVKGYLKYYDHNIFDDVIFQRACFAILKSKMLSMNNHIFFEESCVNIFIALDGLLRLLHRKHFPGQKFVFQSLKQFFSSLLGDNGCFFDYLKDEVYQKRCDMLHPERLENCYDFGIPWWSSEEVAENGQCAWAIMKYLLTDNINDLKYGIDPTLMNN